MTKEEYERLLKSDYWKGYSYSLIKERNFTCEDCGRRFYNERNKLQVHHLVYRDVNPWSYNPDEVVVLCEECHKKRHGLAFEPEQQASYSQTPFGDYDKGQRNSTDEVNERVFASHNSDRFESGSSDYPIEPEPKSGFKLKYVLYGVLLFVCIMIGRGMFNYQKPLNSNRPSYENKSQTTDELMIDIPNEPKKAAKEQTKASKETIIHATAKAVSEEPNELDVPARSTVMETEEEASYLGNTKRTDNEHVRELTTSEILEKRTHANVVKQAQQAGVSTEGTTSEILERITHANVVKQARQAGVSTEGTTSEILERITRKNMEKYNY